jgi:OOP family OmpA-OmpF porin
MRFSNLIAILSGALAVIAVAIAGVALRGQAVVDTLAGGVENTFATIPEAGGINVRFELGGWPTRHPTIIGGDDLSVDARTRIAQAIYDTPGVGGVRWDTPTAAMEQASEPLSPEHCQEDVEALLRARSIRFEESSAEIQAASLPLLNEVASALQPCLGSIIAITGHTDKSGPPAANLSLSRERADAVRRALMQRGIPADGLRARGVGSASPVDGLEPTDPANRRIEFSVIETVPVLPTPIDTPGPN